MNDDFISRQAAINAPVRMVSEGIEWIPVYHVEQLPSAQPEIIRCKDCENLQTDWIPHLPDRHYCGVMDSMMKEDDFCSYAERRTDE